MDTTTTYPLAAVKRESDSGSIRVNFVEQRPTGDFGLLILAYPAGSEPRIDADIAALNRMPPDLRKATLAKMKYQAVIEPVIYDEPPVAATIQASPVKAPSVQQGFDDLWG